MTRVLGKRVLIRRTLTQGSKPAYHRILIIEWSPDATDQMIKETYGNLAKNKKFYTVLHEEFVRYTNSKRETELRELYRTDEIFRDAKLFETQHQQAVRLAKASTNDLFDRLMRGE